MTTNSSEINDEIFKVKPFKYIIYIQNNDTNDYYMDFCIYAHESRNDYIKLINDRFQQICNDLRESDMNYNVTCFNSNNQNYYGFKYTITIGRDE